MLLWGAAIDGVWQTGFTDKDGKTSKSTYQFKAVKDRLTGKIVGKGGELPIKDGVIKGNDISFTVTRKLEGKDVDFKYTGTVDGDKLKLKAVFGDHAIEVLAKRQH